MSDAWEEIHAFKSKQIELRERFQKRKIERQIFLGTTPNTGGPEAIASTSKTAIPEIKEETCGPGEDESNTEVEHLLVQVLCDTTLTLPITGAQLLDRVNYMRLKPTTAKVLKYFLQKLATQSYITLVEENGASKGGVDVIMIDHLRVQSLYEENDYSSKPSPGDSLKRKSDIDVDESSNGGKISKSAAGNVKKAPGAMDLEATDIMSLLSMPSTREKQSKQVGEEILDLLSKPTAKERSLVEKFKSQGGAQVMEFCPHGTRAECSRHSVDELQAGKSDDTTELRVKGGKCSKLHFKKIIQQHTDESLGDCSFLNTCFHMDSCKYVHYEVDSQTASKGGDGDRGNRSTVLSKIKNIDSETVLHPAQWIQCDLRFLDMTILGKFAVIMADPPWDIHMELPYGTMSDDEMRQLGVPALQDDGLIFLWVTGRAMELGRECLKLWGYERSDELIWVKTNQLQRIIRTGRTGHWLNHGKEHCLVGTKGNPMNLNRGLDCDVIVAEVRATSHKPDEIYGIIERLSPGTRKIELFGRPHNVQPNWITLGNQLDGVRLVDPELITQFKKRYPDGNCMAPSQAPKGNIVK